MTSRGLYVVALALPTLSSPLWACQNVVPCVPTSCVSMHPRARAGPGGPAAAGGFTSHNVTLLSNLPLAQIGGGQDGSSLHAWVDPVTRREYAIMGRSNGTAFVDVTNPTQPIFVGNLPRVTGTPETLWREPKVYNNFVFIGVDGTNVPMQVMDLTKLRQYAGQTLNLTVDRIYSNPGPQSVTQIHTLAINPQSGFLYAAGTNRHGGGLHMIDVRNPLTPTFAGGYAQDGYTHEAQVVIYNGPDAAHRGKEIAFNSNGKFDNTDTVSIVDVTNKLAPQRLAARGYPNAGYIHQGWLTEDHRYFFQNDEFDEFEGTTGGRTRTHLWDVSDLDNPVYRGFFDNTTTSIDHNLYVKDGFVYETNYTTGLRILKIGNLESSDSSQWLTEVAWFDTYPLNNGQTFNGAWNNYPYLPSGNILVSDIDGGLFVLRANLPQPPNPIPLPKGGGFGTVPEPASLLALLPVLSLLGGRKSRL